MRSPAVAELPGPPPGRTGWPWTTGSHQLPDTMPDGEAWPMVSVVTPSYCQGRFLEETIRSVLLQGYPSLEYVIMDGGSTDNTVDTIRRYEPWLTYWVSELDGGQSEAINKGLRRSEGDILAWLNSDDTYLPNTLGRIARTFAELPQVGLVFGSAVFTDEDGLPLYVYRGTDGSTVDKLKYWRPWGVPQPTMFFRRGVYTRCGGLDESFHYSLDYEWVLRVSSMSVRSHCVDAQLATYRLHDQSKTGDWHANKELFHRECARAVRKLISRRSFLSWRWELARLFHFSSTFLRGLLRAAKCVSLSVRR